MLTLNNIKKNYYVGENTVQALKGVSMDFRKNEFVSVLGPSGCGKTTLLNIIGGLDKYTSGDLLIDGKSTKEFTDSEWDAYRNNSVGMVFQSYNLIAHLSVLDNVAVALSLAGIGAQERAARAQEALERVGLKDQIHKKPNQLSGGQMQRVAIARALINNPDILLADEPTGALDTVTSVQILELLKEISAERLVVMVTHNEELAAAYSTRIIKLVDGEVRSDTDPHSNGASNGMYQKLKNKKTSMSFFTALKHSFKNLMTKKKRTIITSIAGSIGIIGVALVLAISNGMQGYVSSMQSDVLSGFPITISQTTTSMSPDSFRGNSELAEFPSGTTIYPYVQGMTSMHTNIFTQNYLDYLNALDSKYYNSVSYTHGIAVNALVKTDTNTYKKIDTSSGGGIMGFGGSSYFNELPGSKDFIESQYDCIAGSYPSDENSLMLVVDKYNRLSANILEEFGVNINEEYSADDFLNREVRVVKNNDYYDGSSGVYVAGSDYESLYNKQGNFSLKITGIFRIKETASSETLLSSGIYYTPSFTQALLENAAVSAVALAQNADKSVNVLTGTAFNQNVTLESVLLAIGAVSTPTGIQIYPKDFDAKEKIKEYLDAYNQGKETKDKVLYTDLAETISSMTSTLISAITIVLTAIAAISLVVSSIMIGIITYVSVVERTKEIGILRAIGARKKDISRLFNAETIIIGFVAGVIGIIVTLILSIPVNVIVNNLVGIPGIASLAVWHGVLLVGISMLLTFIGGLIPSGIAAKKDPVVALRTE